jgi:DNA repair protein RadC
MEEKTVKKAKKTVANKDSKAAATEVAKTLAKGHKHGIGLWARGDQPREKLLDKGPQALSDAELIAILMITGTLGKDAVKLARAVLERNHNSLIELGKRSVRDLMKMEGIKEAKAIAIAAALEIGRRRQIAMALERPVIKDSPTAAAYLRPQLVDYPYEVFGVLYLNQAGGLKHFEKISQGGITATTVDPRLIFKKAFEEDAVSIIVSHNHPSGSLRPSKADEALTAKICEGAKYMDIKLLDHIIVGDQGYFSFANEGLLS